MLENSISRALHILKRGLVLSVSLSCVLAPSFAQNYPVGEPTQAQELSPMAPAQNTPSVYGNQPAAAYPSYPVYGQSVYSRPPQTYAQRAYGTYEQPAYAGAYPAQQQMLSFPHSQNSVAPAGLNIAVTLNTSISTQVAKKGDYVQATIAQNIPLSGGGYIPAGAVITGEVGDAEGGRLFGRSGLLSLTFNAMRMPNGMQVPIQAHLVGSIGKYKNKGSGDSDVYRGEGWGTKVGQTAIRGGVGAGAGAALGTALGAITGGVGTGAWAGTAIGGGIGLVDSFVRRGKNVLIHAGTAMQIQLDAPATIPNVPGPAEAPGTYPAQQAQQEYPQAGVY
jgi:hypothetical protein